jgi:hypothetical protein
MRIANFFRNELKESLKVNPLSIQIPIHFFQRSIYDFIFLFESQSSSGVQDVGYINLPTIVTVEIKHLEKILTIGHTEDRIFSDDVTSEDCLAVFFSHLLFTVQHLDGDLTDIINYQ